MNNFRERSFGNKIQNQIKWLFLKFGNHKLDSQKKKKTTDSEQSEYLELGLSVILEHIDQLLKDSELLIKKKRYSSSISLSIIAIEEMGKANVVELSLKLKKPLSDEIWNEITKGGIAHVKKTTSLILQEKIHLDALSSKQEPEIEKMMKKLGIPLTDNKMLKIINMLRKATYLRLENLKHDCLYINRNEKSWISFTNRFSTYEQSAIAYYLFINTLRIYTQYKFSLTIPQKSITEYSKADEKILQNKWKKEVKPIMKKTDSKKLGRLYDHGMLFLHNNYPPDKRGLVKEKPDGWLDLDF